MLSDILEKTSTRTTVTIMQGKQLIAVSVKDVSVTSLLYTGKRKVRILN